MRTPSEGETPQTSGPQLSAEQQQAVAALISGLLVDKDSAYAEEIMNKLHSIYGTPAPTPEPSVAFDDASDEVSDFDAEAANAPFAESEEPIDETDEASNASSEADFESSAIVDDEDNNEEVQDTPESLSEDIEIEGVEEDSPMDDVESSSATLASTASSVVSEAEETIIPETTPASGDNSAEEL